MKRIVMLAAVLLTVVATTSLTVTSRAEEKPGAKADAPYVHCVIFYLKKDAPKDTAKALAADAHELLAKIPTVRSIKIGPPADKATPKFAINDYQVGLLVLLDNFDGLKTYLDHPLHLKYVEKHEKHLDKILVYDFINQK